MSVITITPTDAWKMLTQREGEVLVFSHPYANSESLFNYRVVVLGPRPVTFQRECWRNDGKGWTCVSGTLWPTGGQGWTLEYSGSLSGGGRIPCKLEKLLRLRKQASRERLCRKVLEEFVTSFFKD